MCITSGWHDNHQPRRRGARNGDVALPRRHQRDAVNFALRALAVERPDLDEGPPDPGVRLAG